MLPIPHRASPAENDAMNTFALQAFVFWPGVVIGSALLSMLTVLRFSWSELIIDYMAGVVIGIFFFLGTEPNPSAPFKFLLVFSQGLWGLLYVFGKITSRMQLFEIAAASTGIATLAAGLLDLGTQAIGKDRNVGSGILSFFIVLIKLPFSLFTSGVGLVFWLIGCLRSIGEGGKVGLNGALYVEWSTGGASAKATTLGATVQVWFGSFSTLIDHELYHTREYIYLRDWMIPFWLVGGIWGWISDGIWAAQEPGRSFKVESFSTAMKDAEVGNPLERVPYQISGDALT
jgi:hypothetical protein